MRPGLVRGGAGGRHRARGGGGRRAARPGGRVRSRHRGGGPRGQHRRVRVRRSGRRGGCRPPPPGAAPQAIPRGRVRVRRPPDPVVHPGSARGAAGLGSARGRHPFSGPHGRAAPGTRHRRRPAVARRVPGRPARSLSPAVDCRSRGSAVRRAHEWGVGWNGLRRRVGAASGVRAGRRRTGGARHGRRLRPAPRQRGCGRVPPPSGGGGGEHAPMG